MQSLNILAPFEYSLKGKFTIKEESEGFFSYENASDVIQCII